MCESSLKPIIARLESLFNAFNDHFYAGKLEASVITVSPDIRGCYG